MGIAAKAGCEYSVIVTQGDTTSMRNAELFGFTLACIKATLLKAPKRLMWRGLITSESVPRYYLPNA